MATTDKYDRQLRMWGPHGQKALNETHVCLLTAGPTGSESLKNLVLPGVGRITVIDGKKVESSDLGNNFFVTADSIGRSRAQVVKELLLEMNPDVQGEHVEQDPSTLIETSPEFFTRFTLVIATQLPESSLLRLGEVLYAAQIPLLVCHSYGLLGYCRVVTSEHNVLESKPDGNLDDLRIADPFPELLEWALSFDLNSLSNIEYVHVPYIVILLLCNKAFVDKHGHLPQSAAEKQEYREMVRAMNKIPSANNFPEALENSYKAWTCYQVPDGVQAMFAHQKCLSADANSSPFWVLTRAVKEFSEAEGHGKLPLSGTLPDMTADTEKYIRAQEIYHKKAESDLNAVRARVHTILQAGGKGSDAISEEYIRHYCKHVSTAMSVTIRSLADEVNPATACAETIQMELCDDESQISWYLALRACHRFHTQFKRWPGQNDADVEGDLPEVKKIAAQLLSDMPGLQLEEGQGVKEEIIGEMVRYGNAELHNIAALIGGVCSQEAVKLITHQYSPANNTYLYNGVNALAQTLEL